MKLLITSHAAVLGVNRQIFRSLAQVTGWEVTLVVPQTWRGDLIRELQFKHEEPDHLLKVIPVPVGISGNGSLFYHRNLPAFSTPPDLVFVDEEPWSLNALQWYRHFKLVKKVFYTKQNIKKTLPPPFHQIQNHIFKNSVGAFAVTEEVAKVLRQKRYRGPMEILPHSYDPLLFHPAAQPADPKRIRIGYVGRLDEEKGIRLLVSAIRSLFNKATFAQAPVDFVIIGNGGLQSWVQNEIQSLPPGRVEYAAAIPHDRIGEKLRTLDVLILPSQTTRKWKEQFGRILVEAWASGAAVIGSDSGEIPHLIRRSGGGLIFHESSSSELAARIETYLHDPALLIQHQRAGSEYVNRVLTHDKLAEDLAAKLNNFFKSST